MDNVPNKNTHSNYNNGITAINFGRNYPLVNIRKLATFDNWFSFDTNAIYTSDIDNIQITLDYILCALIRWYATKSDSHDKLEFLSLGNTINGCIVVRPSVCKGSSAINYEGNNFQREPEAIPPFSQLIDNFRKIYERGADDQKPIRFALAFYLARGSPKIGDLWTCCGTELRRCVDDFNVVFGISKYEFVYNKMPYARSCLYLEVIRNTNANKNAQQNYSLFIFKQFDPNGSLMKYMTSTAFDLIGNVAKDIAHITIATLPKAMIQNTLEENDFLLKRMGNMNARIQRAISDISICVSENLRVSHANTKAMLTLSKFVANFSDFIKKSAMEADYIKNFSSYETDMDEVCRLVGNAKAANGNFKYIPRKIEFKADIEQFMVERNIQPDLRECFKYMLQLMNKEDCDPYVDENDSQFSKTGPNNCLLQFGLYAAADNECRLRENISTTCDFTVTLKDADLFEKITYEQFAENYSRATKLFSSHLGASPWAVAESNVEGTNADDFLTSNRDKNNDNNNKFFNDNLDKIVQNHFDHSKEIEDFHKFDNDDCNCDICFLAAVGEEDSVVCNSHDPTPIAFDENGQRVFVPQQKLITCNGNMWWHHEDPRDVLQSLGRIISNNKINLDESKDWSEPLAYDKNCGLSETAFDLIRNDYPKQLTLITAIAFVAAVIDQVIKTPSAINNSNSNYSLGHNKNLHC